MSTYILNWGIKPLNNHCSQQLQEKYADCPRVAAACEIEGRRYYIIRHFTGQAELGKMVAELALRRADREARL